jgi:molybdopterin-containing oxidoreductase family iron-sulfur binding subunit
MPSIDDTNRVGPGAEPSPWRAPRYWRSLDALQQTESFEASAGREFAPGASTLDQHTRRGFLQLMGASVALAGAAGCRWPREKILPFAHREPGHDPGVSLRYATAMELGGAVQGLLVTSYDGRPIKVEGNPEHPMNRGAADLFAQASILDLYDPDRSRRVVRSGAADRYSDDWDGFRAFWAEHGAVLRGRGGAGLRVLAEPSSSATLAALRGRFRQAFPQAKWHEWEPLSRESEQAGAIMALGRPYRAHPRLEQADVIVALDADFLFDHPEAVRLAREYAAGRRADDGRMNRLHAVESAWSITGALADHRHAVPPTLIPAVAAQLAAAVVSALGGAVPGEMRAFADACARYASIPNEAPFVAPMAADLAAHRGRCVLVAGPRQPAEVHAVVHALNLLLGAPDQTVSYTLPEDEPALAGAPDPRVPARYASMRDLAEAMRAGQVETLVILGGNPAYDAPIDLDFAALLADVPAVIHLGMYEDETTLARAKAGADQASWHLPMAHYLESWGDVRAWDGTLSVIQPLIEPLYDGKTPAELLAMLVGDSPDRGHDLVRRTIAAAHGMAGTDDPAFEETWRGILETGVLAGTARPAEAAAIDPGSLARALGSFQPAVATDGLEVLFAADGSTWDGRFANNGWLQELPDSLTKLTWDNAALMSPQTAARVGVKADDLVTLRLGGRELTLAAYVMPGVAPRTVVLPLGYGRTLPGKVAEGAGFDTYRLRGSEAPWFAPGLDARPAGGVYRLACTQDHHAIDKIGQRGMAERIPILIREGTLSQYRADPEFAREMVEVPASQPLWKEHEYDGYRWGMAIDLSSCIGCNACVVACNAENNLPVVGKSRVIKGREMHWIRVDRYFKGDPSDPGVAFQPVACVHCEMAPCEQVCPVAATVHDREGLNVMVYNRCIGTRYCSNNCPYKVRRFNFFDYRKGLSPTERMAMNPEVTVRSRGVMEKCSYCLQRIEAAKIRAKNERRRVRDGEILPACAQTCPTEAIAFGDLGDPQSRVARLQASARAYSTLPELNIKPRTQYLARLRNPEGDFFDVSRPREG